MKKPTGSKDPYALRRAALGVIRLLLENQHKAALSDLFAFAASAHSSGEFNDETGADLLGFFHDRLKVYLRDSGARHDLIDAVINAQSDDLLTITRRVTALAGFLESEDGLNLLAGTKTCCETSLLQKRKREPRLQARLLNLYLNKVKKRHSTKR